MKTCSKCSASQPDENFYKGLWCNSCLKSYKKQWTKNNEAKVKLNLKAYYGKNRDQILFNTKARRKEFPELKKDSELKFKFKLSLSDYNTLLANQNGKCSICQQCERSIEVRTGKLRSLAVDHCHKTNKVRGLLCSNCNRAMGLLLEDTKSMINMITYLERFKDEI